MTPRQKIQDLARKYELEKGVSAMSNEKEFYYWLAGGIMKMEHMIACDDLEKKIREMGFIKNQ